MRSWPSVNDTAYVAAFQRQDHFEPAHSFSHQLGSNIIIYNSMIRNVHYSLLTQQQTLFAIFTLVTEEKSDNDESDALQGMFWYVRGTS
jgi:hypothetical protein